MSADRELLELAAKAAGLNVEWHWGCGDALAYVDKNASERLFWNPLTDDGDALRLAVKLGLSVDATWLASGQTTVFSYDPEKHAPVSELHCDDPCAATRRAIVRAAAEIGRGMGSTRPAVRHGVDCEKAPHGGGNLHDESDDGPFDVDGVRYCGRCHVAL